MSHECPSPDSTPISTSSSKTTSSKGKNRREVVEEIDEERLKNLKKRTAEETGMEEG